MSGKYAEGTDVPITRTLAEIQRVLSRFGADQFAFSVVPALGSTVMFAYAGRAIRLHITTPRVEEFLTTPSGKRRKQATAESMRDAEEQRRWRTMLMVIKAKLAAIEDGVGTFEVEFLPYTMLPSGLTVAEEIGADVTAMIEGGGPARLAIGTG